jgi:P4 family phage/plasmid primase-like protien
MNIKFITSDGKPTHVSQFYQKKYMVDSKDTDEFYNDYKIKAWKGEVVSVSEAQLPDRCPLILDVDIDYPIEEKGRYTRDHVEDIIRIYNENLRGILLDEQELTLSCLLFEKSSPKVIEKEGRIHDGFHLHYPYMVVEHKVRDTYLIKKFFEKHTGFPGLNVKKFSIDKLQGKYWLMYLSTKDGGEPYSFKRAYNSRVEEISLEDVFPTFTKNIKANLPILLSIRENVPFCNPINSDIVKEYIEEKKIIPILRIVDDKTVQKDLRLIDKYNLLDLLPDDVWDDREYWMQMGWILYNISKGSEKGLELWNLYSKKCPEKYDQERVYSEWNKMKLTNKSIGSLFHLMKEKCPKEYLKWRKAYKEDFVKKIIPQQKPSNGVYCDYFRAVFGREYIYCENDGRRAWYHYDESKGLWIESTSGFCVFRVLRDDLLPQFKTHLKYWTNYQIPEGLDEAETAKEEIKREKKIELCNNHINKIDSTSFVSQTSSMIKCYQEKKDFVEVKDRNPNLFCCANGVLDLTERKFRKLRSEDYCTQKTDIEYRTSFSVEILNLFYLFFNQIFVDDEQRNFIFLFFAYCLMSGNPLKLFLFFIGKSGNNGKSTFVRLLCIVFGMYAVKLKKESFLKNTLVNASGPTPEMKRTEKKKIAILDELGDKDQFDYTKFKDKTGEDTMYQRSHKQEGSEMSFSAKIIAQMNRVPLIPNSDVAFWLRALFVEFKALFSNNAPASVEEQREQRHFPVNLRFATKDGDGKTLLDQIAPVFLRECFETYIKKFSVSLDMEIPESIRRFTKKHEKNSNPILQFVKTRLEKTDSEDDWLSLSDLAADFKQWHKANMEAIRFNYTTNELKHLFADEMKDKAVKKGKLHGWVGWKFDFKKA